ncbi:12207_t:CDS:1, partial [Ambispora leptoticha]
QAWLPANNNANQIWSSNPDKSVIHLSVSELSESFRSDKQPDYLTDIRIIEYQ